MISQERNSFENVVQLSLEDFSLSSRTDDLIISIIIPVYNEENSIGKVIKRLPKSLPLEIITVDDGSTDNSVDVIKNVKDFKVKIVQHTHNQGYGAAILSGFNCAAGDIIVTMDADGQHNPEELNNIILPILRGEAEIVVGSRYLGNSEYKIPLHTRMGELIVKKVMEILYRQSVGNNQSGFRGFNRRALHLTKHLVFSRFGMCTEILFRASHHGLSIREVPININRRKYGSSYIKIPRIMFSISTCIALFFFKRFQFGKFLPQSIYTFLNSRLTHYLGNFF